MKKIMFFAAACVALAACSKEIDTTPETGNVTAFEQGQTVTLTVNTGGQTKVTSQLVTSGTDIGNVNFKWETGDRIKITVGTESAEFTLSSGAGDATAQFTGTMPAAGNTFNVQYPVADPDLTSQTYVANALPKDKMKMAATGCTIETPFTLTPQYAALRLNLYSLNREVSQIVVTDTIPNPDVSYSLICSTAVRVGNSAANATPFCIVVPQGFWGFKVDVTSAAATTNLEDITYNEGLGFSGNGIVILNNSFSTSSKKTFTAGVILNMPAKPISVIWAPVNCGYQAAKGENKGYPYGRMYQWGRKYGQGYNGPSYEDDDYPRTADVKAQTIVTLSTTDELLKSHPDGADYNGNFYSAVFEPKNWYAGANADKLWNTNEGTSNPVSKSGYDPCPNGWRVPTKAELEILMGTKTSFDNPINEGTHGTSTVYGIKFDGGDGGSDNYVFLPIAGQIKLSGTSSNRGSSIYYWSSTADNGGKSYMLLKGGKMGNKVIVGSDGRAFGCSVRCVKE